MNIKKNVPFRYKQHSFGNFFILDDLSLIFFHFDLNKTGSLHLYLCSWHLHTDNTYTNNTYVTFIIYKVNAVIDVIPIKINDTCKCKKRFISCRIILYTYLSSHYSLPNRHDVIVEPFIT